MFPLVSGGHSASSETSSGYALSTTLKRTTHEVFLPPTRCEPRCSRAYHALFSTTCKGNKKETRHGTLLVDLYQPVDQNPRRGRSAARLDSSFCTDRMTREVPGIQQTKQSIHLNTSISYRSLRIITNQPRDRVSRHAQKYNKEINIRTKLQN